MKGSVKGWLTIFILVLVMAAYFLDFKLSPNPQMPQPPFPQPPLPLPLTLPDNISINWAGYAVETSFSNPQTGSIDAVEGSWVVPDVQCAMISSLDSSAFWIGIDGFTSSSVEQIGTDSDCSGGSPIYYAWYEMYPSADVILNMDVSPGDNMSAKIEYLSNNRFNLTMTDVTTGSTISTTATSSSATRNSAEWIVEAPVLNRRLLPLADFGSLSFTDAFVTVNGVRGPIYSKGWESVSITMENRNGVGKAYPTDLSTNYSSFSVVWQNRQ
jgi:hypothetical protein